MADLDHIKDVDNNVTYKLVDSEARSDISALSLDLVSTGDKYLGVYGASWHIARTDPDDPLTEVMVIELSNAYNNVDGRPAFFPNDNAATCVRVIFWESLPSPVDPYLNLLLYFEDGYQPGVRYYPVYSDTTESRQLRVSDVYGKAIDFVYVQLYHAFYMISVPITVDALNVSYDNSLRGLQATNVQDAIDEVVDELNNKADSSSLATVATTGDYDDLTNKPTIPAAQVNSDWNAASGVAQILNKPSLSAVATSGDYDDLTNKPSLAAVATSGDYGDLVNTPTLATVATSGDYDDLTNKPTIPTDTYRPINIGASPWLLDNDGKTVSFYSDGTVSISSNASGDITINGEHADWSETVSTRAGYIKNKPTLATVANSGNYSDLNGTPSLATVATSGDYDDLIDKPTFKTINGDAITGTGNITTPDTYPDNWFFNDSLPDVTSLASGGTWARLGSVNIPTTGTWLITAAVQYPSNSTGYRGCGLYVGTSATPTDVTGIRYQQTVQAANGAATNIVLTTPATFSSARNIWIMGRQTSGSAMGTSASPIRVRISAIRLTPSYT